MRVVFFGTPAFAEPFLDALIKDAFFDVCAVVCQPDNPSGRGKALTPPPVKVLAETNRIPVLQPPTLKKEEVEKELRTFNADVFVVVAYGKLIPKAILSLPPLGCVNVHPSLLPKYRGPSPMQWAIKEGDKETGISIMLLDEGMDTGPLLDVKRISLWEKETYPSLVNKIHEMGPAFLLETLKRYQKGELVPSKQPDEGTVTRLLARDDGRIDWTKQAIEIDRLCRAYHPWPGCWSKLNGKRIKFVELDLTNEKTDLEPGSIFVKEKGLFVAAKDGLLEILRLQPEGKPVMSAESFLAGNKDMINTTLK